MAVPGKIRRLLRMTAVAGATLLAAASVFPQPVEAAPKLRCRGAGGKTVLRTAEVRLFTLPTGYGGRTDPTTTAVSTARAGPSASVCTTSLA